MRVRANSAVSRWRSLFPPLLAPRCFYLALLFGPDSYLRRVTPNSWYIYYYYYYYRYYSILHRCHIETINISDKSVATCLFFFFFWVWVSRFSGNSSIGSRELIFFLTFSFILPAGRVIQLGKIFKKIYLKNYFKSVCFWSLQAPRKY